MPSRTSNCKFKTINGKPHFSITYRSRQVTGWLAQQDGDYSVLAGDLIFIRKRALIDSRILPLPSSFTGAYILSDEGESFRISRNEYLRCQTFPAILEYASGDSVFVAKTSAGDLALSLSGSQISSTVDSYEGINKRTRINLLKQAELFRLAQIKEILNPSSDLPPEVTTPTQAAQYAVKNAMHTPPFCYARGEKGEFLVYAFYHAPDHFQVVGVSHKSLTLTLQFPFLPPSAEWAAEWIDDNLSYYVKDDLEIRPAVITQTTKAVVKTAPLGGFVLELWLKH